MALVTCNGVSVVSGSITRPLVGVPIADLVLDQVIGNDFTAGTSVTIESETGYSFKGTVAPDRSGAFVDAVHVRILGGAGGMMKAASARSYVQPGAFVRDVLNGLCSDSGETLSGTTDAGFLSTNLAAWSVLGGNTIARNLRVLLDLIAPSLNWRILADGTIWIGIESWASVSSDSLDLMQFDPLDGSYHLGVEAPFIAPGTNVEGIGNIGRVLDTIEQGQLRTTVWLDMPVDRGINAATQQIAKQALPGVDYYAAYVVKVVSQSGDLTTADVEPVGERNRKLIGGLQRVPVRFGTGVKVQVAPGSTVLLAWDGGSPAAPYVFAGLSGDTVISIQLGGNTPVARQGDGCDGGTLVFFPGTGGATLSYIAPGGIVTPPTPPTVNIPLVPKISQGSSIVGAG